jgi:hypothetical protein
VLRLHTSVLKVGFIGLLMHDDVPRSTQLFIEEMIKGVDAAEREGRGPNKV